MFFSGLQVEFLPEVFGRAKHAGIKLSLLPRYPLLQVWPLYGGQEGQHSVEGAVTLLVVGSPHVCVDAGPHQPALTIATVHRVTLAIAPAVARHLMNHNAEVGRQHGRPDGLYVGAHDVIGDVTQRGLKVAFARKTSTDHIYDSVTIRCFEAPCA